MFKPSSCSKNSSFSGSQRFEEAPSSSPNTSAVLRRRVLIRGDALRALVDGTSGCCLDGEPANTVGGPPSSKFRSSRGIDGKANIAPTLLGGERRVERDGSTRSVRLEDSPSRSSSFGSKTFVDSFFPANSSSVLRRIVLIRGDEERSAVPGSPWIVMVP
jgi:hypothetical protein